MFLQERVFVNLMRAFQIIDCQRFMKIFEEYILRGTTVFKNRYQKTRIGI